MNFFQEVAIRLLDVVHGLLTFYEYIIIAAVLMTWVNPDPYNQVVRIIRQLTEPVLRPVRKWMWPMTRQLGVDISPIFVFIGIMVVQIGIRHLQRLIYSPPLGFY